MHAATNQESGPGALTLVGGVVGVIGLLGVIVSQIGAVCSVVGVNGEPLPMSSFVSGRNTGGVEIG